MMLVLRCTQDYNQLRNSCASPISEINIVNVKRFVLIAGVALSTALTFGAGLTFIPDSTFQGSALTGWQMLGQATWSAKSGELTGTPKESVGGWLILDRGYQDAPPRMFRP
jgi:hypothetical protein